MFKWIFILSLILEACLCANISPVALLEKTPNSTGNINNGMDHKIVGGYDATLGEAPWQVGLFNTYGGSFFCGGTLLSPRVVITAAHCMGRTFTVRLGGLTRTELPLEYPVKEIFVHQNYSSRTSDNDIALLILEGTINLPSLKYVEPASLPMNHDDKDDEYENQTVLISGWGSVKSGANKLPSNLQAASVKIFSQDLCKKSYRGYRYSDNMICAGLEDYTKDSCQGDSGGPLVLKGESSNSPNTLLGITSWGVGCAYQGYPGVYTKVSNYVSWIEEKACSGDACLAETVESYYRTNSAAFVTTSGYILMHVLLLLIWR